jgi:hypothetical protein
VHPEAPRGIFDVQAPLEQKKPLTQSPSLAQLDRHEVPLAAQTRSLGQAPTLPIAHPPLPSQVLVCVRVLPMHTAAPHVVPLGYAQAPVMARQAVVPHAPVEMHAVLDMQQTPLLPHCPFTHWSSAVQPEVPAGICGVQVPLEQ